MQGTNKWSSTQLKKAEKILEKIRQLEKELDFTFGEAKSDRQVYWLETIITSEWKLAFKLLGTSILIELLCYFFIATTDKEFKYAVILLCVVMVVPLLSYLIICYRIMRNPTNTPWAFLGFLAVSIIVLSMMIGGYAGIYRLFPTNLDNVDFLPCLYYSLGQWTTGGYEDYDPSKISKIVATTESLIGIMYNAIFISAIFLIAPAIREESRAEHSTIQLEFALTNPTSVSVWSVAAEYGLKLVRRAVEYIGQSDNYN